MTDWFNSGRSIDELKILYKATEIWDGKDEPSLMPPNVSEDVPEATPSTLDAYSSAETPKSVSEADRVINGLSVILSKRSLKDSDPTAFLYMAYGMMEEIRNGKSL